MRIAVSKQYRWVLAAVLACYAVSAASSNRSAAPVEKAFSANRLPVSVLTLLLADANGPTPAVPTTNGPSGSITLLQPSFSWSPSASATSYRLTVTHGGTTDFSIVYAAGAAACADESGACSVTPAFNFISGTTYSWSIQAINAAGYSAASTLRTFTTNPVTGGTSLAPLAFTEKPFGSLMLVDTIDTALVAPDTQSPALVSSVQTIAGRQSRTLVPGPDARYMTYRIGAGKGLVAKQAYVLDIEYPDDVPRAMFIANRGADFLRGFTTGSAVGDSRKSWTQSTLESLNYPQSGGWKNYHSLFYLHERFTPKAERNSICALRPLLPADGFDVSIFQTRKLNDPRSNGAAVGKIRLYKVVNQAALPAAITYPGNLPRRHLFWREEMADEAISNNDPAKRATVNAIDWFSFKMDMGSALGFNTVGKDLMEWGANQGFDSGDSDWIFNAKAPRTNIWAEIVAQASSRGLYLMPYLEYGGSLGNNCLDGQSCDTSVGSYKSMGFQRRTRKLFHGIYGPGTALDWYTTVSWAEEKSADLTDPDTETDLKMVLDKIIVQYKNNTTSFAGVWLRMRQTKLPMSFSAATLQRYNADNPGAPRTLLQLQSDELSRQSYYNWWYGKRRAFLKKMRDHIRNSGTPDDKIQILFSADPGEPVPDAFETADSTRGVNLVSDDPAWWSAYAKGLTSLDDPTSWYRNNWKSRSPAELLAARMHKNGLEKTWPVAKNSYNDDWLETTHSAPPADPVRYQNDDGMAMTYDFGNALYTVGDSALLASYGNIAGQSLTHHFPLNEDNGESFSESSGNAKCADPALRASAPHYPVTDVQPFDGKLGYMSVAVERSGPFTVLAEATALANGNPVNIGYLESSSMSRGFPAYVKRFNQALLSLPALPAITTSGKASDATVVVKQINSPAGTNAGTYYAVVNPTMQSKTAVTIDFGAGTTTLQDLLAGTTYNAQKLQFNLYPGEVRTFRKP